MVTVSTYIVLRDILCIVTDCVHFMVLPVYSVNSQVDGLICSLSVEKCSYLF